MKEEGMKREERGIFPEKNFWKQKIQNRERPQLRLAPLASGGGGVPLPTRKTANLPEIRLYNRMKRRKGCKGTHEQMTRLKTA